MRKLVIFVTAIAISVLASSCVKPEEPSSGHSRRREYENYTHTMLASGNYRSMPSVSFPFSDSSVPETTGVNVYAKTDDDTLRQVDVDGLYGIDYYHSQVPCRVGMPIELAYPEDIGNLFVEFTYDEDELRGIDESIMSIIHFDESTGFYLDVDSVVDTENDTVAFCPEEPGVYLIISAESFGDVFAGNYQTPDYSEYESEWERSNDTGDVMTIADTDWALANAPVFNVSTPAQLAGVVWYTNVYSDIVEINLMNDIDLAGYDWAPMGCYGLNSASFSGVINGNGYSIINMTITESGFGDVGFVGHSTDLTIYNINFIDANVSGGGCTGIVGGEVYGSPVISNVYVTGEVSGYSEVGTILGRETGADFEDCSVNVLVNGEPNAYFSNYQQHMAEAEIEELFEVSISPDGVCTRNIIPNSPDPLSWCFEVNGEEILSRNCVDETSFDLFDYRAPQPGDVYTVYLVCHDGTYYVRCSNVAEITVE